MKNKVLLGICVFLIAALSFSGAAVAKDKIVIGQAISLSGPMAGGASISGGPIYELWVEDVNKNGGIYVKEYGKKLPVELLRYDDKSDIGTMTNLLEKLIVQDKVDFILPPWSTSMLFAAAPSQTSISTYLSVAPVVPRNSKKSNCLISSRSSISVKPRTLR